VQVEQLVPTEYIRRNPGATSIPGADGVFRVPFGAHPFSADGFHGTDREHIREYVGAAEEWLRTGSRGPLDDYLERYVFGPSDHVEYLEAVGLRRLLSLSEHDG
jgi:glutaconate CoA-transferase, subunit A